MLRATAHLLSTIWSFCFVREGYLGGPEFISELLNRTSLAVSRFFAINTEQKTNKKEKKKKKSEL